jgi:outer membrane immunogenic protein
MLKRIAPALVALAAASPVVAADLPSVKDAPLPPPVVVAYDWTGFYLGADLGGAWAQGRFTALPAAAVVPVNVNGASVLGGGFVGYNRQFGRFVLGLEGDVQGLGVNQWDVTRTYQVQQGVLGSINGRVGVAFDRLLVYAIGGVAFSNTTYRTAGPASLAYNSSNAGYDIGGGVEYAVTPNWTLRGEYRYYDFGKHNNALAGFTFRKTENTFRVGLAYKFGAPEPVAVVARY